MISTGFLKYPLELKKNFSENWKKKFSYKRTEIFFQCSLKFFFSSRPVTEKKFQWAPKKNFSLFITEILSQFEMNAKMDISKNQWRSTGGEEAKVFFLLKIGWRTNESGNLEYFVYKIRQLCEFFFIKS